MRLKVVLYQSSSGRMFIIFHIMILIISPSKTQDFSTTPCEAFTQTRQIDNSKELVGILKSKSEAQIATLMSLSEKLAKLNFDRFQSFQTPFTLENAKQALLAFKGDVYNGIDAPSLSEDDLNFAQDKVRMLSGLYGVIRPLDLIQPYRLEMGTKLANNKGKNLYEFWGAGVSEVLNEDEDELIINLASNEYFKSIDKKSLKATILNIAFKEKKGDVYKIIGIFAKRARGLMVNYIIRNRLNDAESLKGFTDEGYEFSSEFSDNLTWVFTRG